MKRTLTLAFIAIFLSCAVWAQEEEKKPTAVSETIYILPKAGMASKFEAAVKAHNDKFHPEGAHLAGLRRVDYGANAGWYVWVMKGTYASLDSRPTDEGHEGDWNTNIEPMVEKYGNVGLWEYDEELSYGLDMFNKTEKYQVWAVDLKRGQNEAFKTLIGKVQKAYESMGNRAFLVFNNAVHTADGPDVAMVWSFNNFAELDSDWGTKDAYEKLNGEGSWAELLAGWLEITNEYDAELRSFVR